MALSLVDRIVALCDALDTAEVPWALGGAIALAYATEEPRGTRDVDVNVFLKSNQAKRVFVVLPAGVVSSAADLISAKRDDQVRLWWDDTPIDLFFSASQFHDSVSQRVRRVPFAGRHINVLCSEDLAVFKALFDRPKDWIDIATMAEDGALDCEVAALRLEDLLGVDPRVDRLRAFTPR
jgi:pimeloyl-ACP methyl ester carboxylesterase